MGAALNCTVQEKKTKGAVEQGEGLYWPGYGGGGGGGYSFIRTFRAV